MCKHAENKLKHENKFTDTANEGGCASYILNNRNNVETTDRKTDRKLTVKCYAINAISVYHLRRQRLGEEKHQDATICQILICG